MVTDPRSTVHPITGRRRLLLAALGASAALAAFAEAPAAAQPWYITWADLRATIPHCAWELGQYVCGQWPLPLPDGDLINYFVEHGVVSPDAIEVRLVRGPGITYWKQVAVSGSPDVWKVWTNSAGPEPVGTWCNWPQLVTPGCNTVGEWASVLLSPQGQIVFGKGKGFNIHEDSEYVLRELGVALRGGDRVTFTWSKD